MGHGLAAQAPGGAGQVGEPVGGGAPAQLALGDLADVELGQQLGLQRGRLGLESLQLGHPGDQLRVPASGPQ